MTPTPIAPSRPPLPQPGSVFDSVDARTRLAGTNRLEVLLFSLGVSDAGHKETYGINVFKVREVLKTPPITAAPDMPPAVKGVVSLRGAIIPVIDLTEYCGTKTERAPQIMLVTEYNQSLQAFLVEDVDTILRLDWGVVRTPPAMLASSNDRGLLTAMAEAPDGRLVMMVDVEKILVDTMGLDVLHEVAAIEVEEGAKARQVFFADDSSVARRIMSATLDKLGAHYRSAVNGREAWDSLQAIAQAAETEGASVKDRLHLIITDVEMPEMDGYVLTQKIKADPRFSGIPVLMFSSLSGVNNQLGKAMGVDAYIPKMDPVALASAVMEHINVSIH